MVWRCPISGRKTGGPAARCWRRIVAGELALVYLAVLIANWNASFFNALEQRNWSAFSRELIVFCLIVLAAAAITASNYFCGQTLQIRWRRWLTANYVSTWMAQGRHYRVRFVAPEVDNIHLRIASDVYLFIQRTHELTTGLLGSVATLFTFAYILWGLSAVAPLPLFGMDLSFPGLSHRRRASLCALRNADRALDRLAAHSAQFQSAAI